MKSFIHTALSPILFLISSIFLLTALTILSGCDNKKSPEPKIAGTAATNPKDNAEVVWVPGAKFTMGSPTGIGNADEHPEHQVTLDGYWIYKNEVTVAQYRAYCTATSAVLPEFPTDYSWQGKSGWSDPDVQLYPIVNVTWDECKAYAAWAGVNLPTEAQWEYAARGPEGRNYPWGGIATATELNNGWDQNKCANYYNSEIATPQVSTRPVGSFPLGVSWCGANDMAGNVFEWCLDRYGSYPLNPVTNPTGAVTGNSRILRSAPWKYEMNDFRGAYRNYIDKDAAHYLIGFRCASPDK